MKTVNIKGKEYVEVKERVKLLERKMTFIENFFGRRKEDKWTREFNKVFH